MKSTAKQEHNLNLKRNSYIPKMSVDPCPMGSTTLPSIMGKLKIISYTTMEEFGRKKITIIHH